MAATTAKRGRPKISREDAKRKEDAKKIGGSELRSLTNGNPPRLRRARREKLFARRRGDAEIGATLACSSSLAGETWLRKSRLTPTLRVSASPREPVLPYFLRVFDLA
jgi:hypothetical protein